MKIEFDPDKRNRTLIERGLDYTRAVEIFLGKHLTNEDSRKDYLEHRFQTIGWLDGRLVVVVWTPRGSSRRIISMRKANEREIARIGSRLD